MTVNSKVEGLIGQFEWKAAWLYIIDLSNKSRNMHIKNGSQRIMCRHMLTSPQILAPLLLVAPQIFGPHITTTPFQVFRPSDIYGIY